MDLDEEGKLKPLDLDFPRGILILGKRLTNAAYFAPRERYMEMFVEFETLEDIGDATMQEMLLDAVRDDVHLQGCNVAWHYRTFTYDWEGDPATGEEPCRIFYARYAPILVP